MRKIIILAFAISAVTCTPVAAHPQYNSETLKQMEAAGLEYDVPLDEIMSRQRDQQERLKHKNVVGNPATTDPAGDISGAKFSNDEFRITPNDKAPDDGYNSSTWGELHINSHYARNVYHPNPTGTRFKGWDELRYVDDLN